MPEESTRGFSRTVVEYGKSRLTVTSGPNTGVVLDIAGTTLRVGTAPENDLVLADTSVSRRHCEIEASPDGVRVRDMGSTNGVLVRGMRIYDAALLPPVVLQLGETMIAVTALPDKVSREQATADRFGDLLGRSARMRELFADLARIAPSDVTLLVEGETGTGKDMVAESVHRASPRSERPYIVFDCGAVAPSLVESELFGHERGAFTGATNSRSGVFELAEGGTLFLDELGELPKELQPKLLRVLEKRELRRVGASKTIPVDVRVVAATNRNIMAEVARGAFREDLYYRVAAAHVTVPALRDRMSDLTLLLEHFLSLESPPRSLRDVPAEVLTMFAAHRWPGNVRELRNAAQRLLVTPERALSPLRADSSAPDAAVWSAEAVPLRVARRDAADAFERSYLQSILAKTGGNVTRAAAIAEVSRQMIQKLMRKYGLGGDR